MKPTFTNRHPKFMKSLEAVIDKLPDTQIKELAQHIETKLDSNLKGKELLRETAVFYSLLARITLGKDRTKPYFSLLRKEDALYDMFCAKLPVSEFDEERDFLMKFRDDLTFPAELSRPVITTACAEFLESLEKNSSPSLKIPERNLTGHTTASDSRRQNKAAESHIDHNHFCERMESLRKHAEDQ